MVWYGMGVSLPHSQSEILAPKMTVSGSAAFGRCLGHEGSAD